MKIAHLLVALFVLSACESAPRAKVEERPAAVAEHCFAGTLQDAISQQEVGTFLLYQQHNQGPSTLAERRRVTAPDGTTSESKARWVFTQGAFTLEQEGQTTHGELTPATWPWTAWTVTSTTEEGDVYREETTLSEGYERVAKTTDASGQLTAHFIEQAQTVELAQCQDLAP